MNIPLLCVLTVATVRAPVLWHVIYEATVAYPAPPHSPCLGIASGFGATGLLVLHGHHVIRHIVIIGLGRVI